MMQWSSALRGILTIALISVGLTQLKVVAGEVQDKSDSTRSELLDKEEYERLEQRVKQLAQKLDGRFKSGEWNEKIREMEEYLQDKAYALFVYSPLSLFAVNREVDFVPQKCGFLSLKDTCATAEHWSAEQTR